MCYILSYLYQCNSEPSVCKCDLSQESSKLNAEYICMYTDSIKRILLLLEETRMYRMLMASTYFNFTVRQACKVSIIAYFFVPEGLKRISTRGQIGAKSSLADATQKNV